MAELRDLQIDNRFVRELPGDPIVRAGRRQVHGACYSRVEPTRVSAPRTQAYAVEVAQTLGLSEEACRSDAFAQVFAGNGLIKGMEPYAACYGGHQFGNWAGQLGDGRAITLGEALTQDGGRLELQLKGAGPTPYSRTADGRAVLRSSVREFLCSEAMHHLGVPTTRALSLVTTGETVVRDMFYDGNPAAELGAVVCRVAPSFLRFGNFELPASRRDAALLETLANHTIEAHFPELGPPSKEVYLSFLEEVCRRTAVMIAHWMRVGFVHGVMNTDNMSILGLTIDYGPYGWLEDFDLDWTPNTTDSGRRRYRYGNQPAIGLWNVTRLAEALHPLVGDVDALTKSLAVYSETFERTHREMMTAKLGLATFKPGEDDALFTELTAILGAVETDMTIFYRALANFDADVEGVEGMSASKRIAPIMDAFYNEDDLTPSVRAEWSRWIERYVRRISEDDVPDDVRRSRMNDVNPHYVLRNYIAQLAIDAAEKGDPSKIVETLEVLRRPYEVVEGYEAYAGKRPEWARHRPGCSMLSCSS